MSDLRPATLEDAPALLELVAAADTAEHGEPDVELADIVDGLSHDTLHAWVGATEGGDLTAYLWVERPPGEQVVSSDVVIHPTRGDTSLYPGLIELARRTATGIEPGLPHKVFVATGPGAAVKRTAIEAAGGRVVRHFWRLRVALGEDRPVVPPLAAGVTIDLAGDGDEAGREMYDVLNPAFLDHYDGANLSYEQWCEQVTGPWTDRSLWWLAHLDGVPSAALLARAWEESGYVGSLGTLAAARGRGLARALLLTSFAEFHDRGKRFADLTVDAANPTNAVALYTSVGMSQHFGWDVYELPPAG